MTNLDTIAALCESMYYAGRPKVDKRFSREDFKELARMSNASIMRDMWFQSKQAGEDQYLYFQDAIVERDFSIGERNTRGRRTVELDEYILKLPANLGVFYVRPATDEDCVVNDFIRIPAGTETFYSGEDFEDMAAFTTMGKKVHLYNCPDCLKNITIGAIFNDDEIQIPEDVAARIVEWVRTETLKSPSNVDKTNNNNPNVDVKQ